MTGSGTKFVRYYDPLVHFSSPSVVYRACIVYRLYAVERDRKSLFGLSISR